MYIRALGASEGAKLKLESWQLAVFSQLFPDQVGGIVQYCLISQALNEISILIKLDMLELPKYLL
jgi:hypothetical protein